MYLSAAAIGGMEATEKVRFLDPSAIRSTK